MALEGDEAEELGLVTFALDDIDWEDEIRVFLEGRASFSPDSLTGMRPAKSTESSRATCASPVMCAT